VTKIKDKQTEHHRISRSFQQRLERRQRRPTSCCKSYGLLGRSTWSSASLKHGRDSLPNSLIEEASGEWRIWLRACGKERGRHFEHLL